MSNINTHGRAFTWFVFAISRVPLHRLKIFQLVLVENVVFYFFRYQKFERRKFICNFVNVDASTCLSLFFGGSPHTMDGRKAMWAWLDRDGSGELAMHDRLQFISNCELSQVGNAASPHSGASPTCPPACAPPVSPVSAI